MRRERPFSFDLFRRWVEVPSALLRGLEYFQTLVAKTFACNLADDWANISFSFIVRMYHS